MTLLDLFPLVAIVAIMYLLLIRPAKKRQQEQNRMISALSPGMTVMTASGILGTVREVGPEIGLEIAPGVVVRMVPAAIARVIPAVVASEDLAKDPEEPTKSVAASAAPDSSPADTAMAPQPNAGVESRQQP